MRRLFTILTAVALTTSVFLPQQVTAQAPEKMNYQAVVRDVGDNLVTNTNVGMQISILQGSAVGTSVYVETQTPTTNSNGLVSIEIGSGTVVSGNFANIDWGNNSYFIKTEIDPNGGISYTITGTSQLISVPYALHAKTATSITVGASGHYIGELYGGGIVFLVTPDGEHGLIASLDDLDGGSGVAWSATVDVEIGVFAQSMTNGAGNTAAIVTQDNTAGYAATLCDSYTGGGFIDWYLPSNRELNLLVSQDILIDLILDNDGDNLTNGLSQEYVAPTYGRYWSSTEDNDISNSAWSYFFDDSYSGSRTKSSTYRVRAVRRF